MPNVPSRRNSYGQRYDATIAPEPSCARSRGRRLDFQQSDCSLSGTQLSVIGQSFSYCMVYLSGGHERMRIFKDASRPRLRSTVASSSRSNELFAHLSGNER